MQVLILVDDDGLIGEVQSARPDSSRWGRAELMSRWIEDGRDPAEFPNPRYAVVRMPGRPVDLHVADPLMKFPAGALVLPKLNTSVERFGWYVDLSMLPDRIRQALVAPGGEAILKPSQFWTLKSKREGEILAEAQGNGERIVRKGQAIGG